MNIKNDILEKSGEVLTEETVERLQVNFNSSDPKGKDKLGVGFDVYFEAQITSKQVKEMMNSQGFKQRIYDAINNYIDFNFRGRTRTSERF